MRDEIVAVHDAQIEDTAENAVSTKSVVIRCFRVVHRKTRGGISLTNQNE